MADYLEEQRNELEALESIYSNELTVISREPAISFQLELEVQSIKDAESVSICINFEFPQNYPDVVPDVEITNITVLEEHIEYLTNFVKETAEENIGTVMIFNIVSALQEKLVVLVEDQIQSKREEEKRNKEAAEASERKKFEGTKVTIESFLAWKSKFDEELLEVKKAKSKEDGGIKKLTGKELFMNDHAMDDSDVKFLEEGGEVVEVDESLFQDVDVSDIDGHLIEDLDLN